MNIERKYYTEALERHARGQEAARLAAMTPSTEAEREKRTAEVRRLLDAFRQTEAQTRREPNEDKILCFELLTLRALQAAKVMEADLLIRSDRKTYGFIRMQGDGFTLHAQREPELCETVCLLLQNADDVWLDTGAAPPALHFSFVLCDQVPCE